MIQQIRKRFLKNESGATAIEYGLIAALIAVVIITATQTLGNNISTKFNTIATTISAAGATPAASG